MTPLERSGEQRSKLHPSASTDEALMLHPRTFGTPQIPLPSPPAANRLPEAVQTPGGSAGAHAEGICVAFLTTPPARKELRSAAEPDPHPVMPSRCDKQPVPAQLPQTLDTVIVGGNMTNRWCKQRFMSHCY